MSSSSDLQEIISAIRSYPGLTRKLPIKKVLSSLPPVENAYFDLNLLAGSGDDSAAFQSKVEIAANCHAAPSEKRNRIIPASDPTVGAD